MRGTLCNVEWCRRYVMNRQTKWDADQAGNLCGKASLTSESQYGKISYIDLERIEIQDTLRTISSHC